MKLIAPPANHIKTNFVKRSKAGKPVIEERRRDLFLSFHCRTTAICVTSACQHICRGLGSGLAANAEL